MSEKVEVKKVLEFFDEWYKYYSQQSNMENRRYKAMDPEQEAARDRVHCMACSYRSQARVINSLKDMFAMEFGYGIEGDDDE